MRADQICVLIPSLEPDSKLPEYASRLSDAGFGAVVVINDGSSAAYDPVFAQVAALPRCIVLRHEVNRGKGQALRTGVAYVRDHTSLEGIVTADADGQHTVADTLRLAERLLPDKQELILGSRDFSRNNKNVPWKSRCGNRITSSVFKVLYGVWLPDTQTGLRAVARNCFDLLLDIQGDRYDYEMNMLIRFSLMKIPFVILPIETIYENNNEGSHFHPLRDSWRIYKLIFSSFFRYSAASIVSFLIDYAVLSLLMFFVFKDKPDVVLLGIPFSAKALYATPIARLCSAPVNYLMNKYYSFHANHSAGSLRRYVILAFICLVCTMLLFGFLDRYVSTPVLHLLLKAVIDVALYLLNYRIQQRWVFTQQ